MVMILFLEPVTNLLAIVIFSQAGKKIYKQPVLEKHFLKSELLSKRFAEQIFWLFFYKSTPVKF